MTLVARVKAAAVGAGPPLAVAWRGRRSSSVIVLAAMLCSGRALAQEKAAAPLPKGPRVQLELDEAAPSRLVRESPAETATKPPEQGAAKTSSGAKTCQSRQACSRCRQGWWERWQGRWARGKRRLQEIFLGYPEEFEELPLGSSVYAHAGVQIENAEAAQMVLYRYDFVEGTAQLNSKGRDRLSRIAILLPQSFFPVVIERTPCAPELDESRRSAVYNQLAHGRFPIPPERVVIGPAIAIGLSGLEAELIYRNMLLQTQTRGVVPGQAGIGGGFTPQGFGAASGGAPPR